MAEANDEHELIRSYLLGGLTPEEREHIERRVFTDAAYREMVELIEEELIEEFAEEELNEGALPAAARQFLSTRRRRLDLFIVKALHRHGPEDEEDETDEAGEELAGDGSATPHTVTLPPSRELVAGGWRASLSRLFQTPRFVVGLALSAGLAALMIWAGYRQWGPGMRPLEPPTARERLQSELARLNAPQGETEAREARAALSSAAFQSTLTPGAARLLPDTPADEYPTVEAPAGGGYGHLRLKLKPNAPGYVSYRAVFELVDGGEPFTAPLQPFVEDGEQTLGVTLPLSLLTGGDYRVQLDGRDASGRWQEIPDHYYYFRLVRR